MASAEQPQLLTVREVAERLQVSSGSVLRWARLGLIPVYRVGPAGRVRIRLEDADGLIRPASV